jgi:hypothetical protein
MFFPGKPGRSGCRRCWFGAGRQPGFGIIARMALWMPSADDGAIHSRARDPPDVNASNREPG